MIRKPFILVSYLWERNKKKRLVANHKCRRNKPASWTRRAKDIRMKAKLKHFSARDQQLFCKHFYFPLITLHRSWRGLFITIIRSFVNFHHM